jgi:hypothetical protein
MLPIRRLLFGVYKYIYNIKTKDALFVLAEEEEG